MVFHRRGAKDAEGCISPFLLSQQKRKNLTIEPSGDRMVIDVNKLSGQIIGAAIEVHRILGPGLLESAYEECLCHELTLRGLSFESQRPLPITYKGKSLDCGYRLDIVVEKAIILELKSCEKIDPIHKAQLLTYLKLADLNLGLLLNFNVPIMREGIVRIVNKLGE